MMNTKENQDNKFLEKAIQLSTQFKMDKGCGPFGCVIVKDNKIIGKGWNTVLKDKNPTAHAEINAIEDACRTLNNFQLTDCIAYCSSEPCPMCLGALYWARVKAVYYANSRENAAAAGFDDAFIFNELDTSAEKRKIPFHHYPSDEAKKVFEIWKKQGLHY